MVKHYFAARAHGYRRAPYTDDVIKARLTSRVSKSVSDQGPLQQVVELHTQSHPLGTGQR